MENGPGRHLTSHAWKDVLKEAKKCDLLCSNCHIEIEDERSDSRYKNHPLLQ